MISPPTIRPGRGMMRRIDCAVTVLPQPGLADDAERPAALQRVADAVDGADGALVEREVDAQVAHFEQQVGARRSDAACEVRSDGTVIESVPHRHAH